MREHHVRLMDTVKHIYPVDTPLGGTNPKGDQLSFSNYYMEKNGYPSFTISGEFHFSRYDHRFWEDEIIKMKLGGITVIPTYIFWNHHEEIEGVFEWKQNKNLTKFVELCGKHGLYVILRIGPFNHGEARNGGMPDWLFGRPFELRSNDESYLSFVSKYFQEIGKQIQGLCFKDGGPIIGTQLENEFQHAAAPWEMTTGTSNSWMPGGRDGDAHIKKLKHLAIQTGIDTPIYTATAWGGAAAPTDSVLPLWGGYAYWPWIFYGDVEEHPATPSFIFRDYHNNDVPETFDFEPNYQPESLPFACAEMGGGMTVFYNYRFTLPHESVDALSAIKVAGGCNFVGYYVFHGGSNPTGKKTPFLNETATPKISYDYQAPIGEFGQIRKSYKRLKRQHYFYKDVEKTFAKTKTMLPDNRNDLDPHDVDTLRYAIRITDHSGFVFINNFQDHVENKDQNDFFFSLEFDEETVRIPETGSLTLERKENCILPFHMEFSGCHLRYATTQLITTMEHNGEDYYFFFIPKGMHGEYCFDSNSINSVEVDNGKVTGDDTKSFVYVDQATSLITLQLENGERVYISTWTEEDSLHLWKVHIKGKDRILRTEDTVLVDNESNLRLEYEKKELHSLEIFPAFQQEIYVDGDKLLPVKTESNMFQKYWIEKERSEVHVNWSKVDEDKAVLDFSPSIFKNAKELLLKIDYVGDVGYAFIDGELIHDNFCNNDTWEIGLKRFEDRLLEKGMYVYISPLKEGVTVKTDSPMAARLETAENTIAVVNSIKVVPIYESTISLDEEE
ncbi:hypothetical protein J2S78_000405 [Salibacterium salarium]|uniref:beta-galactosidase n=1 Tax=Salibacterium salarium TaxID=284579 RepID=UPI00277D9615|nr:beta-galactosidase [Salibacterium salarium]MDQ0297997.1 hypothetical protein [Salibacterium salarium]